MQLTLWTYEGPPHIGAMRVATAMRGLHYVLHAPQGDTYADLLFTMIERRGARPPVTYTTFQARDLGGDTAELFKNAVREAYERFAAAGDDRRRVLHGRTHPGRSRRPRPRARICPSRSFRLSLPAYQKKENWGAAETFYRLVRTLSRSRAASARRANAAVATFWARPRSAFAIATTSRKSPGLLERLGVEVRRDSAPGRDACRHRPTRARPTSTSSFIPRSRCLRRNGSKRHHGQPFTRTVPIGVGATRDFIAEVARLAGRRPDAGARRADCSRLPWYSRSVNSTYLTGKRVFIFGDATHVVAAARIARG